MKRLMNFLLLSCKKSTELIEKKLNTDISLREEIRLKIHMSMCSACTLFSKQSQFLDQSLQHNHDLKSRKGWRSGDSAELKEKIIKSINQK